METAPTPIPAPYMVEHRIDRDHGRNVHCTCGDEFSVMANLRQHIDRANELIRLRSGRGMQIQVRINGRDLDAVMSYTGGEYPVSGDMSRTRLGQWTKFLHRNLWALPGVTGARR